MAKKYDYIIVGAGSTGCVLANRLSEDPSVSVLLLEAGGKDRHPYIHIPGAYAKNHKTARDWGWSTTPQPHVNNRRLYLPRGKTLGGSSATNAMAYIRGNKADYDQWATMGNQGWSYDELLPYFKKSECNEQIDELDRQYHGASGPLHVSYSKAYRTELGDAFIKSCKAAGIPQNEDCNGQSQVGTGRFQFTIKDGKRQSTAVAFLNPVKHRKNLEIKTNCLVDRVVISRDRATGVECLYNGTRHTFDCSQEVILSAGAFVSPAILNRSGIGDQDELYHIGIECKKELHGVGKNLQDHVFYFISGHSKTKNGLNSRISIGAQLTDMYRYLSRKQGPLTASPLEAYAFFNLDSMDSAPDMQFHFAPIQAGKDLTKFDPYDLNSFPKERDGACILPSLINPKSVGTVKIQSANPIAEPIIDPQLLSHKQDRDTLLAGGRKALEVFSQDPFTGIMDGEVHIGHNISDDELMAHILSCLETIYHPVGTCKMGLDDQAVVDDQLRVHGIEGLRVADASIMPNIVSGNTNATCIMIGEKCSDMIKGIHQEVRHDGKSAGNVSLI